MGRYYIHKPMIAGSALLAEDGGAVANFSGDQGGTSLRELVFAALEREGHAVLDFHSGDYLAGARLDHEPPAPYCNMGKTNSRTWRATVPSAE